MQTTGIRMLSETVYTLNSYKIDGLRYRATGHFTVGFAELKVRQATVTPKKQGIFSKRQSIAN